MDITVSILDHRCLVQSELITRCLYSTIHVGTASQSSRTVAVQDVKFSSGTLEDPLIISLINGQTQTVMFVRNIPMSAVYEKGLFDAWVAVYPPGDPQNLFFDVSAAAREGCPQVHLRATIVDVAPGSTTVKEYNFAPEARRSMGDPRAGRYSLPHDTMRGVSRPAGDPEPYAEDMLYPRMTVGATPWRQEANSMTASTAAGGPGSISSSDSVLHEKQVQARQIKEHLAELSRAQRNAQDSSHNLQDSNRILDNMKKQLQGLEAQISETKVAAARLEYERDQFFAEERTLQEEIRQRDVAHKELLKARDEIDRKLSEALGERERQKLALQTSTSNLQMQTQALIAEEASLKKQVTQLKASLASREQRVADMERRAKEAEERRLADEDSRAEELTSNLNATLRELSSIRAQGVDNERRCQDVDITQSDLCARLAGVQSEMASVKEKDVSSQKGADQVTIVQNQAVSKRAKLTDQLSKVQVLEEELRTTRELMIEKGMEITELTGRATEADVLAKERHGAREELALRLEIAKQSARSAAGTRQAMESELAKYEEELAVARATCKEQAEVVEASRQRRASQTMALEVDIDHKSEELRRFRKEMATLQEDTDRLSQTAKGHRRLLQKNAAEEADSSPVMRERVTIAASAASYALQDLGAAISNTRRELRSALEETIRVDSLSTSAAALSVDPLGESRRMIAGLQHVIDSCAAADQSGVGKALPGSRVAIAKGIQGHAGELERLEEAVRECERDLDTTRSQHQHSGELLASMERSLKLTRATAEEEEAMERTRQQRTEEAQRELQSQVMDCHRDMGLTSERLAEHERHMAELQESLRAAAQADSSAASEGERQLHLHAGQLQQAQERARRAAEQASMAETSLSRHLQAEQLQVHLVQSGLLGPEFLQGAGNLAAACAGLRTKVAELETQLHNAELVANSAKAAEANARDLPVVRAGLQKRRSDLLDRKDAELLQYGEQIELMEEERKLLAEQLQEAQAARQALEDELSKHESPALSFEAECAERRRECDVMEGEVSRMKEVASELKEQREALFQQVTDLAGEEAALLQRHGALEEQCRVMHRHRELAMSSMGLELEREDAKFGVASEGLADQESALGSMQAELERLMEEIKVTEVEGAAAAVNSVSRRTSVASQRTLICHLGDGTNPLAASEVAHMEKEVQALSDRLAEEQDQVSRSRAVESELRGEIQTVRGEIKALTERMTAQIEQENLQYETVRTLQERKHTLKVEVNTLAFGVEEAERQCSALQQENGLLHKKVAHLFEGSELRHFGTSADVALSREEIQVWKDRAEKSRAERLTITFMTLQTESSREQHLQELRTRISSMRGEVEQKKQAMQQLEKLATSKNSQDVRSMFVIPGQLAPLRPIPHFAHRRKALLIGVNYNASHAPLKGCINDMWNMRCMLRHTMQYREEQVRVLLDGPDEQNPERLPTRANILEGLRWLTESALPGDVLLFAFAGYGTQQPRAPGDDQYEAHLVPCDFAAELPAEFSSWLQARHDKGSTVEFSPRDREQYAAGYRLLPLIELRSYFSYLPKACRMTVLIDSCYPCIPGISTTSNFPTSFTKVDRGHVNYAKMRDYIIRPRFLELPPLPVRPVAPHLWNLAFPCCWLHCFSACQLAEWSSEFPIEGTVQGVFSWMFLKALARGHFHTGVFQVMRALGEITVELKSLINGIEQTAMLQLSECATVNDVVLFS